MGNAERCLLVDSHAHCGILMVEPFEGSVDYDQKRTAEFTAAVNKQWNHTIVRDLYRFQHTRSESRMLDGNMRQSDV